MNSLRSMLLALVAVAILIAPVVSVWAGVATLAGETSAVIDTDASQHAAADAPMMDCASMMKSNSNTDDCRFCAKEKVCPAEFCMAKCFKLAGIVQPLQVPPSFEKAQFQPTGPARFTGWSDQLQPPPPRT